MEVRLMKTLTLTDLQYGALYDIVRDAVDYIEGDLVTFEDENGNEILEDINEYEIYQIYKEMRTTLSLKEEG
tara:strand:- start:3281 stop:3496 length:216 start_codon:yes stop_codon:yes gene_type:complete